MIVRWSCYGSEAERTLELRRLGRHDILCRVRVCCRSTMRVEIQDKAIGLERMDVGAVAGQRRGEAAAPVEHTRAGTRRAAIIRVLPRRVTTASTCTALPVVQDYCDRGSDHAR